MQRRRIALDEATPRQRELVNELVAAIDLPGSLIGLILGDGPWDVRVLTAEGDRQWVTRQVDPGLRDVNSGLQNDPTSFDHFRLLLGWATSHSPTTASGELNGKLWYRRPYAAQVATDIVNSADTVTRLILLRDIARLVEQYHSAEQVHGNVALSNVLVHSDGSLSLVDPGFALHCSSARFGRSALAPEIGTDTLPTPASDIYSLAKIGRKLFSGLTLSDELARLLEVMLSPEITRRPSIHWVLGVLNDLREDRILAPERGDKPKGLLRGSASLGGALSSGIGRNPPSSPADLPVESAKEPASSRLRSHPYGWVLIPLAVVAVVAFTRFKGGGRQDAPLDTYWMSGQRGYMRDVAAAAITDNDPDARLAILDAARNGFTNPLIRSEVLTAAVDPRWDEELTQEDITTVLRLAVGRLIRDSEPPVIPNEIHPGVLFGILARSPLEVKFPELQTIPPSKLQELPQPIGGVFKGLQALGLRSVEEREVRAAAHLLADDIRPPILEAFVAPANDEGRLLAKLDIVKESLAANQQLCIGVLGTILERSPSIRSFISWFDGDGGDTWKSEQPHARFLVSLGVLQPDLTYEQLIDLLFFPRMSVREAAGRQLLGNPSFAPIHEIIPSLVRPNNGLSRIQAITLAGALQTNGRDQLLLVHGWLTSNPSPITVAHLLIARDGKGSTDGFNLEASRYLLKSRDTKLPREMLVRLSTHSESMARAYAYARLDPENPDDRRALEAARNVEKKPRLVQQLAGLLR